MKVVFWGMLALSLYTFVLYPVCLLLFLRLYPKQKERLAENIRSSYQPTVSFIIAAHNEEAIINKKIQNTLTLNYPKDKLQIIIASDNSTDTTNKIVLQYPQENILLLELQRGGKTNAQNQAVQLANGDILVFSDANSMWEKNALSLLVRHFVDPQVAYACGQLKYLSTHSSSGHSEGLYWKYEILLRRLESGLRSITAGNGAIYAVRAIEYENINPLYSHDLELPHLMVSKGKLAIYEPTAVVTELAAQNTKEEYHRKIRMLTRTWHRILTGPGLYNPLKYGVVYAWMMVSHRLFRYLMPFFQVSILLSTFFLWECGIIYQCALIIQIIFYSLALIGALFSFQHRLFYLPYYFCMFNFTSLVGLLNALTGKASPTWKKAKSTRNGNYDQ